MGKTFYLGEKIVLVYIGLFAQKRKVEKVLDWKQAIPMGLLLIFIPLRGINHSRRHTDDPTLYHLLPQPPTQNKNIKVLRRCMCV